MFHIVILGSMHSTIFIITPCNEFIPFLDIEGNFGTLFCVFFTPRFHNLQRYPKILRNQERVYHECIHYYSTNHIITWVYKLYLPCILFCLSSCLHQSGFLFSTLASSNCFPFWCMFQRFECATLVIFFPMYCISFPQKAFTSYRIPQT